MPQVKDVYNTITDEFPTIVLDAPLVKVQQTFQEMNPMFRTLYVLDDQNQFIGTIPLVKIIKGYTLKKGIITSKSSSVKGLFQMTSQDITAQDLMVKSGSVCENDSLDEALQLMVETSVDELPVLDKHGSMVGHLSVFELLSYL
ncbi:CBS domain-containing protein [Salipaludibacillus daqingensis]|uniref:CBS domain-containing protein n=1 Tax=Salipaludibacillus daqingensis TaxID=3041001 RepID=UPI002475307C|nr:CBS domain-containing protein [Salipaludibacillus daqingensis]